ncbi:MAG: exodeoxyribonuclease V subunit gamma [Proteobacteria bacterium]|nr:MAG: exodeoxyribonuclease V subunit gamma [Pseudomonadota bacterium]
MFVLHTSNYAENLLEHLTTVLSVPQQSVLATEVFLIQSQGMERWLSQQLASRSRLWGNFEYLFPAKFFNAMSGKLGLGEKHQAFSRENLLWQFEGMLRELTEPVYQPLHQYLQGDAVDRKRFQLAQQLAYLYDQYQFMRPDWLALWQRGELIRFADTNEVTERTQKWQAALWRALLSHQGTEQEGAHHGQHWLDAIERLKNTPSGELRDILPERVSVFGINTLSPIYLAYLQALSQHIQVHFYLLNPCQEFWAESHKAVIQQMRQQSLQLNDSDTSPINPLLAMLGQQGRDFQILLLEQQANEIEIPSFDAVASSGTITLLQQLQNDILNNQAGCPLSLAAADNSLSIHACHSRMREVEVLKDQLIASFEADPQLDLRDVVVMAPDIQTYLPYIDAMFDDIPYAVADRSLRQSNHLLDILLRFFALSQSRMLWDEVVSVLEEPVVAEQFGLFDADLAIVRHWIQETRIRWGESALHREALGLGHFAENSWQHGLERLLMGYAVPSDQAFCDGVLPYSDIEGSQAQALGGFYSFFKLLKQARGELAKTYTLAQWLGKLHYYAGQLLMQNQETELAWGSLRELFETLGTVSEAHTQSVTLLVLTDYLESAASEQKTATGFMRGQLTFCSMLPMRAIPFKVIALLGMNEGEFPSVDGRAAFDLMDVEFRRGDRSRRADERYQFLEILVSSREKVLISYLGQSIKNNDEIPPSVVVAELLDVLDQYYHIPEQQLVTRHPLQAHSARYFQTSNDNGLFSYSEAALGVARRLQTPPAEAVAPWWQGELLGREPVEAEMVIDLQDLFRFFAHPQRYFVEKHLQIRLKGMEEIIEPSESFELNNLEKFLVNQEWLSRYLSDQDEDVDQLFLQRLRAQGRWPQGELGEQLFENMSQELSGFVDKLRALDLGEKRAPLDIDYSIGHYRLRGTLDGIYERGNLLYRYARCKPADQLKAWLSHLILVNSGTDIVTYFLHMDGSWQFTTVAHPEVRLLSLLDAYRTAQSELSQLLLAPAVAYTERLLNTSSRSKKTGSEMAVEAFEKIIETDAYYQLLYRGGNAEELLAAAGFQQGIDDIIQPLFDAKQGVNFAALSRLTLGDHHA